MSLQAIPDLGHNLVAENLRNLEPKEFHVRQRENVRKRSKTLKNAQKRTKRPKRPKRPKFFPQPPSRTYSAAAAAPRARWRLQPHFRQSLYHLLYHL